MAGNGVRTSDLNEALSVDSVIGNSEAGTVKVPIPLLSLSVVPRIYNDVAALSAAEEAPRGVGSVWDTRPGDRAFEVTSGEDFESASGVKMKAALGSLGTSVHAFNVRGDENTVDTAGLSKALNAEGKIVLPSGGYKYDSALQITRDNVRLEFSKDAFLVPGSTAAAAIQFSGAAPSTWIALASDAVEGAESIVLSSASGWAVGDTIELRSEGLIPGVNTQGDKIAQMTRIAGISGTTVYLDRPLFYTLLVADAAKVGKPTMRKNVLIDGANINRLDYTALISWGMYFKYCERVTIIAPSMYGNKTRNAADTNAGVNMMTIGHGCLDVEIFDFQLAHSGWYGIGISGAVDGVKIFGGEGRDCRHVISIVWGNGDGNSYGEPLNIKASGVTGRNTNLSVFDSHDTGRFITWEDCHAFGSRSDSGFQVRSKGVTLIRPVAAYNNFDGIIARTDGQDVDVQAPDVFMNGRSGLNLPFGHSVVGGHVRRNGREETGYALLSSGGSITGTRLQGKEGAADQVVRFENPESPMAALPLLISGVRAPRENSGQWFITAGSTRLGEEIVIENSDISDYGDNLIRNGASGSLGPIRRGNIMYSDPALRKGRATLSSGYVRVPHTGIYNRSTGPNFQSQVSVRPVNGTSAKSLVYVEKVGTGAGYIDIRSMDPSASHDVEWEIDG